MSSRVRALAAVIGSSALLLAACGSVDDGTGDAAADATSATPSTVTVTTQDGEVTLPTDPQAALGFYTTDVDILITLGYPLASGQPVRDDYDSWPDYFPQEELADVAPFHNYPEFNFEQILTIEPDFILNGLGYDDTLYDQLSPIAPTYTYNAFTDGADWRDNFAQIATDLGREEQYQAWTDAYDARIEEIKTKLDEADVHPTVALASYYEGQVLVDANGVPGLVFLDLGLPISPLADPQGDGVYTWEGSELSQEQLGDLADVDVLFTGVDETGATFLDDSSLQDNSLWTSLPVVENDQIFGYNYEMGYGSPSGQMAFLDVVEEALLP